MLPLKISSGPEALSYLSVSRTLKVCCSALLTSSHHPKVFSTTSKIEKSILDSQDLKDFSRCTQIEKFKPDLHIHSSGLDNGGGGPAVATPSKEEKQRTASKKEVSGKKKRATHCKNV